MPPSSRPILTPGGYSVFEEGTLVKLQMGNSVLPFTWDAAIRISSRIRVYQRDAQEYMGMARTLDEADPDKIERTKKHVVREAPVVMEGDYKVYADGPDTVLEVGNGKLTMTPEVARNISTWLRDSGGRIQEKYFPDMTLKFSVANLTDKTEHDRIMQGRRDATAVFTG